jgi:Flp pilus assembly protein TadG
MTATANPATAAGAPRDRGSVAVEVVLIAPLLIVLLVLVAGFGRIAHARGQVDGAAADAARAASLQRDPGLAQRSGEDAARAYLGADACRSLDIRIDTAAFRPGGAVRADVRCVASLAGLGLAGFPGSRTFTATATVPLDTYRSR